VYGIYVTEELVNSLRIYFYKSGYLKFINMLVYFMR